MYKLPLTLSLIMAGCLSAFSQSDTSAIRTIAIKNNELPTEHIYLHMNKPRNERTYKRWFRLYDVTNGHKLSAISHTAFAELVGPNDTVIQKLNLKLDAGMASGNFDLPFTVLPGTYHIRAYTNWMRSQGEDSFFTREIIIGNPGKVRGASATDRAQKTPDLQFFPEGGDLIEGLRSVVAYKATSPDGSAAMFTGIVSGTDGQVLAELQDNGNGMGVFALTPRPNENYFAKVTFANGGTQTINLPKAITAGYTLTVNNHDNDTLQIKVAANAALLKTVAGQSFYLLAQSGGKVYYTASGKTDATAYRIKIAKSRFPTGITRITLYAQNGEPVSERVAFIQSKDNLDIKLNPQNSSANIELIATAQKDKSPSTGSFSAAVFNEDRVPFDQTKEPTILSTLLLTDELHGNITDPKHFLADANDMDLLMLTQGYRKLELKKFTNITEEQQSVTQYQNEDGLSISGTVTDNRKKPVTGAKLALMSTNPLLHVDTITDSKGRFAFTGLEMDSQIKFLLKAENEKKDDLKISLDRPEPGKLSFPRINNKADTSVSKQLLAAIQNSYKEEEADYQKQKGRQLKEVTIKDKYDPQRNIEEALAGSANLNGPGHADQIVMGKDLENMGCPSIADCLRSKLAMVEVVNGKIIDISRGHNAIKGVGAVNVYIDGSYGVLDNISVNDIYSVELLTSAKYKAIYGNAAAGGLLLVTTKRGIGREDLIPVVREPGLISFSFSGYAKVRTYYQPKYDPITDAQPSAIYWKPDVFTDKDGKAILKFNNEGKGHYRVVVEGIDGEGRLGRAEYTYEVK